MTTAVDVADIRRVAGPETWRLADNEYRRFAKLLRQLDADEWSRATDCHRWDVRAIALHILGWMEANASPVELVHQFRRGLPLNKTIEHRHFVDGVNELPVQERDHLLPAELMVRLEATIAKAFRGRIAVPPPLRWAPLPLESPIGWKPLSYLLNIGFTRDTWMHRIDVCRATRRDPTLSADHDARIIADLVAEWGRRHREPFTLALGGPAGGRYRQGADGESIEIDAVEFCRILAGRETSGGVLRHKLPL